MEKNCVKSGEQSKLDSRLRIKIIIMKKYTKILTIHNDKLELCVVKKSDKTILIQVLNTHMSQNRFIIGIRK